MLLSKLDLMSKI